MGFIKHFLMVGKR